MRLNLEKCVCVEEGNILGFMLTYKGTKANSNKCQALANMRSLRI